MLTNREQVPYLGLHGFFMAVTYGIGGLVYPVGYRGSFANWLSTSDFFEPLVYATLSFLILSISYIFTQKYLIFPVPTPIRDLQKRIDPSTFVIVSLPVFLILHYLTVKQGFMTSIIQPAIALRVFGIIWGAVLFFSGRLNVRQSVIFWVLIGGDIIFNSGLFSGFLADMIWYSFYFLVPYMVFKRRIPFLLIFVAASAIFILNPIKEEFRENFDYFIV